MKKEKLMEILTNMMATSPSRDWHLEVYSDEQKTKAMRDEYKNHILNFVDIILELFKSERSLTKITKTTDGNITTYFYNGVKKYEQYKDSDGYCEWWREYKDGKEIHYKNIDNYESWQEYEDGKIHYKNNRGEEWWGEYYLEHLEEIAEEDVKPFEFVKE